MNEVGKAKQEFLGKLDDMRRELDGFSQSLRKAREALDVPEIETECIGVGDEVKKKGMQCAHTICTVISGIEPMVFRDFASGSQCSCMKDSKHFTLIRKGPRKHVFEGVEWKSDGLIHPVFAQATLLLRPFVDDGKTYCMTLEEK